MDLECFATDPDIAATKKRRGTPIGIFLGKIPGGYARIDPLILTNAMTETRVATWTEAPQAIYAVRTLTQGASRLLEEELRAQVVVQLNAWAQTVLQAEPQSVWHPQQKLFHIQRSTFYNKPACFWLLEVGHMENTSPRPGLSHPEFECLVICTFNFDATTDNQQAMAHVLVEDKGMWVIGNTRLFKPPRQRFSKRIFREQSNYSPRLESWGKTALQKFQEWLYEGELANIAVHSGPKTDVMVGVNVSKLGSGDGGFRIDVTVSYVEKAGTSSQARGYLTKWARRLGL
ncbi:hypothetical protein PG990_004429 [Apiospora arundinis]